MPLPMSAQLTLEPDWVVICADVLKLVNAYHKFLSPLFRDSLRQVKYLVY